MATKIEAGDATRSEIFHISPDNIIVSQALNGRWEPHTDEAINKLVLSYEEDGGQLQPVQVRRLADRRVELVLGYRRHAASVEYNRRHPEAPMKLKCLVVTINEEEALRRNIAENQVRERTTPMDDAITQNRLRETFGWSDTKIAAIYDVTQPYVSQLKKLLLLANEVQRLVHGRQLAVGAALALAALPESEQRSIIAESLPSLPAETAKGETGTILSSENPLVGGEEDELAAIFDRPVSVALAPTPTAPLAGKPESLSQAVSRRVRDAKIGAGGKQARTLRDVRQFFEGLTGPAEKPGVRTLAETLLKFVSGHWTDKTMTKKLEDLFPTEETGE